MHIAQLIRWTDTELLEELSVQEEKVDPEILSPAFKSHGIVFDSMWEARSRGLAHDRLAELVLDIRTHVDAAREADSIVAGGHLGVGNVAMSKEAWPSPSVRLLDMERDEPGLYRVLTESNRRRWVNPYFPHDSE